MRIVFKPVDEEAKEDLIKALAASELICPDDFGLKSNYDMACDECWRAAFEAAEKNGEWIPVSQQLPYEGGKYMKSVLVTMEDCKGGRFVTNTLDRNVTRENKIVSWMPVPKVYKGEA